MYAISSRRDNCDYFLDVIKIYLRTEASRFRTQINLRTEIYFELGLRLDLGLDLPCHFLFTNNV